MSHMHRRGTTFYFRRRLPRKIASLTGREFVWRSLDTGRIGVASERARRLSVATDEVFRMAEGRADITADEINRLLRDYIKEAADLWSRDRAGPAWVSDDARQEQLEVVDHRWSEIADDLRFHDSTSLVEPLADRLIAAHGLALRKGTPEYKAFCRRVAQAELERLANEKRLIEEYNGPVLVPSVTSGPAPASVASPDGASGPLLSELWPDYVAAQSRDNWTPKTKAQSELTYRLFSEVLGDRHVAAITRADIAEFLDMLAQLPRTYGKSKADKEASIHDIVKRGGPKIAAKTVKRHLTSLNGFFAWAKMRGVISGDLPTSGFKFKKTKRAREERPGWTDAELEKLFASPIWTGCKSPTRRATPGAMIIKDALYWIPLIALYGGLRLEEAAQLRPSDIKRQDGIVYLDIHAGDGNMLKSKAAVRKVPIHSALTKLGFLTHVHDAKARGDDRLFPELRPGGPDKRLGFDVTKRFSRYRNAVGLKRKGTDLHSLRSAFATALQNAGVPEATANELLGHEGATISYARYGKGVSLPNLATAIEGVRYDFNIAVNRSAPR